MEAVLYVIANADGTMFYRGEIQRATSSPIFAEKYVSERGAKYVIENVFSPYQRVFYPQILPVKFTAEIIKEDSSESSSEEGG